MRRCNLVSNMYYRIKLFNNTEILQECGVKLESHSHIATAVE